MKKQIVLFCSGNKQVGVVVEELSVHKVIKSIIADLSNPKKQFICFADYVPSNDSDQELWVKSSTVEALAIKDISNIQVPNKGIFVPGVAGGKVN